MSSSRSRSARRSPPGARRREPRSPRRAVAVGALALGQGAIGVIALLLVVPIWAGLLHQAFAMLLFGMAVAHWRATAQGAALRPD